MNKTVEEFRIPNEISTNDGVFAMETLDSNLVSMEYPVEELSLNPITSGSALTSAQCSSSVSLPGMQKILIRKSSQGVLKVAAAANTANEDVSRRMMSHWIKKVKLSQDVNSFNALIELTQNNNIRLRLTKTILNGHEIIAWFSENVSVLMMIPFLSPTNIRGNDCYTCHVCGESFQSPNPLKIHLALSCSQQPLDTLWIRLSQNVRNPSTTSVDYLGSNCSNGSNSTIISPLTLNANYELKGDFGKFKEQSSDQRRCSAFKPIFSANKSARGQQQHRDSILNLYHPVPVGHAAKFFSTSSTYHSPTTGNMTAAVAAVATASTISAAAQIETIVSNMGASKHGHLCIYCGKVYSRKYGLKIHIRTHTGFKPLKCKFCFRPFGDPSNLNKHVRLHLQSGNNTTRAGSTNAIKSDSNRLQGNEESSPGTFKCHLCPNVLIRKRDLQRHLQVRHHYSGNYEKDDLISDGSAKIDMPSSSDDD